MTPAPQQAQGQRRTRPGALFGGRGGDGGRRSVALATVLALGAALQLLAPWTVLAQQQAGAAQGGGGGGDPVEIVADSLVVEQDQRLATFAGNVDAVQGTLRLRSDRLLVYYDSGEGEGGQPASAGGGGQGIRRLEASGNVSIASPGQTASGDRGIYEVAAGQVTLEGNVVLTRADNVVRGAKLDSNLRTGVSTVSAAQPGASGKPEQRVRALFVPGGGASGSGGSKPAAAGAAAGKKAP